MLGHIYDPIWNKNGWIDPFMEFKDESLIP
jgi:hypothetical protein